jgi:hypothetical protein
MLHPVTSSRLGGFTKSPEATGQRTQNFQNMLQQTKVTAEGDSQNQTACTVDAKRPYARLNKTLNNALSAFESSCLPLGRPDANGILKPCTAHR